MLRLYEGCYLAQKIDENTFGTINITSDTATYSHMVKLLFLGPKADNRTSEAFPLGELGKRHAKELIQTCE